MRLASIIRRVMPSPQLRSGPPIWDRPDPPNNKKTYQNRRVHLLIVSTQWRKNISLS